MLFPFLTFQFLALTAALGLPSGPLPNLAEPVSASLMQMGPCDNLENLPMSYNNVVVSKEGDNTYRANGTIIVSEEIPAPILVSATVNKCGEKLKRDTCEFYTGWKSEGCKEMKMKKGPLYSMMQSAGDNSTSCPLKMGTYHLNNYEMKIPTEAASMVAMVGKYWEVIIKSTASEDRVVMCTVVWIKIDQGEVKRVRKFKI